MRPNIILILADDMGYSDLGCFGAEIHTPNLDHLAQNGVRLTQMYNCARCCPSRATLLTGLWPHQAGIGQMANGPQDYGPAYQGYLNNNCVTIAEALGLAGYHTLMAGKWHVGPGFKEHPNRLPLARGFDRFWGIPGGGANYFHPNRFNKAGNVVMDDGTPVQADGYLTDMISDHAVSYIDKYANSAKPFFLYTAYTAPHWPLHALPEDIARYRDTYQVGWDTIRKQRYARMVDMGIVDQRWALTEREGKGDSWEQAQERDWQALRMAVYAAQIDRLDQGVGRIVAKLQEKGIFENTLIMFASDNGGCAEELGDNLPSIEPGTADTWASYGLPWANASNTPFRLYKHWVHEGGISTPFIAHWPQHIQPGSIAHEPAHFVDMMATCLDAAGANYPHECNGNQILPTEGHSLLPLLAEGKRPEHPIFWEHEGNRAVRQGRWKLVARFLGGSGNALRVVDQADSDDDWHLYNMEADRTELHDVAEQYPEKVAELMRLYEEWAQRVGVLPWQKWSPGVKW